MSRWFLNKIYITISFFLPLSISRCPIFTSHITLPFLLFISHALPRTSFHNLLFKTTSYTLPSKRSVSIQILGPHLVWIYIVPADQVHLISLLPPLPQFSNIDSRERKKRKEQGNKTKSNVASSKLRALTLNTSAEWQCCRSRWSQRRTRSIDNVHYTHIRHLLLYSGTPKQSKSWPGEGRAFYCFCIVS